MCSQVWLRFEKRKKDGAVIKLRIQDMPPERIEEATELMVKYFLRDEPVRRALGFHKNQEAQDEYREYISNTFRSSHNLMCCHDSEDENPIIIGVSIIALATSTFWELTAGKGTPEATKITEMYHDCIQACDLLKLFNLTSYYSDKSLLVVPEYRGNGIAEKFLTVRRLMCAAHKVPLTGAWMTNFATQIAGERDGWETVHEIPFDFFTQKYGLTFENAPPTIKLMVGRPHPDYRAVMDY